MFDSDKKQENKTTQIGINTRIKQSFVTEKEMKAFLKKGGKIDYLEMGETRAFIDNGFTKRSETNGNSAKKSSPLKGRITESILIGDEQPQARKKIEVQTEAIESLLKEDPKPQAIDYAEDIALNIHEMRSDTITAYLDRINTNQPKISPVEFRGHTAINATFKSDVKSSPTPILFSLIKANKKRKRPNSATQADKDESARIEMNAINREVAIWENKNEHTGICLTHGEVVFRIYMTRKKQYRSRCNICRSTRYTEDGKVTPCTENMQRLQEIKVKRREAIKQGKKEFIATCKYHGLTTYVVVDKKSRCKICKAGGLKAAA